MKNKVDTAAIPARHDDKYREYCIDPIAAAHQALQDMIIGTGSLEANLETLSRNIRILKDNGEAFDLPAIGTIARRLEEYLGSLGEIHPHLDKIQIFLDKIREIAQDRRNPEGSYWSIMLERLPRTDRRAYARSSPRKGPIAA